MLEHSVWQELVLAYVKLQARALGWVVHKIKRSKSTRSVYVSLRCGDLAATVRLSDHRPSKQATRSERYFCVRQAATVRLMELRSFLTRQTAASD